jgi:dihydrofolate reductase
MRVIVINHLTLDGVMQGPGREDEDTRGGFDHGGWAAGADDEALARKVGSRMAGAELLLGRRSYDDMLASWNSRGGPFKDALNAMRKHVVSGDPEVELPWPNSTLVSGDVPAVLRELRNRDGGNLVVMGSGELIRSALIPHGLIDEFLLMIHPLVFGEGQRMFDAGGASLGLHLIDAETMPSGVIVAAYEPPGTREAMRDQIRSGRSP